MMLVGLIKSFLDEFYNISKTENYSMSGAVKYDEKSEIGNPITNHPYSFLE